MIVEPSLGLFSLSAGESKQGKVHLWCRVKCGFCEVQLLFLIHYGRSREESFPR